MGLAGAGAQGETGDTMNAGDTMSTGNTRVDNAHADNAHAHTTTAALFEAARAYVRANHKLRYSLGVSEAAPLDLHALGEGEHNVNYWFAHPESGQKFVLRINVISQPFHAPRRQVAYEATALTCLAPSRRTPRALYVDVTLAAPANGALVTTFCPGSALDLDTAGPRELAQVACAMADVHAVPVDATRPLHRPASPAEELFSECVARFEAYERSGREDARITQWAQRFMSATRAAIDTAGCGAGGEEIACIRDLQSGQGHIINTEPLASHFLVDAQGEHTQVSFIDWERPIVGDPAQDVAYFTMPSSSFWDSNRLFTLGDASEFVTAYLRAVDGRFDLGDFDRRLTAYRALTALRSVTWCCKALARYGGGDVAGAGGDAAEDGAGAASEAINAGDATPAHTTSKTALKLPTYLSDEFMELLYEAAFTRVC